MGIRAQSSRHGAGMRLALLATTALIGLANFQPAMAQSGDEELEGAFWLGEVSGDWRDGRNWFGGQPPNTTDIAITVDAGADRPILIRNGQQIDFTGGVIAGNEQGDIGAITIMGTGSRFRTQSKAAPDDPTIFAAPFIGSEGTGTLSVLDGGQWIHRGPSGGASVHIGGGATGSGTLIVRGAGSLADIGERLFIGEDGAGFARVENGGRIATCGTTVAANAGSQGTLSVSGAGSQLTTCTSTGITIGRRGEGQAELRDGGRISTLAGGMLGQFAGSSGTLVVDGAESAWINGGNILGQIVVGDSGSGRIEIRNGGRVQMDKGSMYIAGGISGTPDIAGRGTVVVDGSGSLLSIAEGALYMGQRGSASLEIRNGGQALVEYGLFVNRNVERTSNGDEPINILVTGAGSLLRIQGLTFEGIQPNSISGDAGGNLAIENGGVVDFAGSFLLNGDGRGPVAATIDGAGSKLLSGRMLTIGVGGDGSSLVARNGAEVSSRTGQVGFSEFGSFPSSVDPAIIERRANGRVTLSGLGTSWTVAEDLTIGAVDLLFEDVAERGATFANGAVHVEDGATLSVGRALNLGFLGDTFGTPSTATGTLDIDGGTVRAGSVSVANVAGANGALIVGRGATGGTLETANVTFGAGAGTLSGTGTITGAVSMSDTSTLLGRFGQSLAMGSLALSDATNINVTLGTPSAAALFNITGNLTLDGRLNLTNGGGFAAGSYRLFDYGGTLTNNGLVITSLPTGFNPGDWSIDTATGGNVNLIVPNAGPGEQYWDGANLTPGNVANGRGGRGVWNAGNTNWTNQAGSINAPWAGGIAVFNKATQSGNYVAIDPAGVTAGGIRTIDTVVEFFGGTLTLNAGGTIDTGTNGNGSIHFGDRPGDGAGSMLIGLGDITQAGRGAVSIQTRSRVEGSYTIAGGSLYLGYNEADERLSLAGALIMNSPRIGDYSDRLDISFNGRLDSAGGILGGLGDADVYAAVVGGSWNAGDRDIIVGDAGMAILSVGGWSALGGWRHLDGIARGSWTQNGEVSTNGNIVLGREASGRGTLEIHALGGGSLADFFSKGPPPYDIGIENADQFGGRDDDIFSGTVNAAAVVGGIGGGAVVFRGPASPLDRHEPLYFTPRLDGNLSVEIRGSSVHLSGLNTYSGTTTIDKLHLGGLLTLDGATLANSSVNVVNGTLAGHGLIGGNVTVSNDGVLLGRSGQTLAMGSLALNDTTAVNVALGAPSAAAIFNIAGNLTLDGRLNVTDGGGFAAGSHRLFDYGGTLTNNGLVITSLPTGFNPGDWSIDTATGGNVNLIVPTVGPGEQYWDGASIVPDGEPDGLGGDGIWDTNRTNWTNQTGTINAPWAGGVAVFASKQDSTGCLGGTQNVSVVATGVSARGLRNQNSCSNPTFSGGAITLADNATIGGGSFQFENSLSGSGNLQISGVVSLNIHSDSRVMGAFTIDRSLVSVGRLVDFSRIVDRASLTVNNAPIILNGVAGGTGVDEGLLNIEFGGEVVSRGGVIGETDGSDSAALITGGLWNLGENDLVIGDAGTGLVSLGGGAYRCNGGNCFYTKNGEIRASRIVLGQQSSGRGSLYVTVGGGPFIVDGVDIARDGILVGGTDDENYSGIITANSIVGGIGGGEVVFDGNGRDVSLYPFTLVPTLNGNLSVLVQDGAQVLLRGMNDFSGATTIRENGALSLDGATLINSSVNVINGTLAGYGSIGGNVTVSNDGVLLGRSGQTLAMGSLALNDTTAVNVALGAPSATAIFNIAGNLTLDGRLNVTDGGGFATGSYRLFDYGGTLTNNGLVITSLPIGFNPGDWSIDTATGGNVNLIVPTAGPGEQYWDGSNLTPGNVSSGRGGNGVWNAANTNWTNQAGSINAPWAGGTAVFTSSTRSGDSVVIDAAGVMASGLRTLAALGVDQRASITFTGGDLTLAQNAVIDTQEGGTFSFFNRVTALGALTKDGPGVLTSRGDTTVNGPFTVRAGFVEVFNTEDDSTPTFRINGGFLIDGAGTPCQVFQARIVEPCGPSINVSEVAFSRSTAELLSSGGVLGASPGLHGTLQISGGRVDVGANDLVIGDAGTGQLIVGGWSGSRASGQDGWVTSYSGGSVTADQLILGRQDTGRGHVLIAGGRAGYSDADGNPIAGADYQGLIQARRLFGGAGGGTVIFDHYFGSDPAGEDVRVYPLSFAPQLSGNLSLELRSGETRLQGLNDFSGPTTINGGLLILGDAQLRNTSVSVQRGVFGGSGTIGGAVTVGDAGILEGRSGQSLTMGSLTQSSASDTNVTLGAPSTAALFNVLGDLVLDGTLNVSNGGGFGDGVYRIFDYGGTLTDNGLEIGTLPGASTGAIQTSIARQVNLVVGGGPVDPGGPGEVQFWNGSQTSANGTVSGGAGAWNGTSTNWTDANGTRADAWGGRFAVFQGTAGTVTVDAAGVNATGMQFAVDGYRVEGGAVTLAAPATLRVGDGSAAGAGYTATIASAIGGTGGIDKTDLGTLILTGANSYTGGTRVSGGTLIGNAGSIRGDANIAANASLVFDQSDAGTFAGVLSGAGGFAKRGAGALTLAGDSAAFTGASTLEAGSLFVNGSLGGALSVRSGATLGGTGRVGDLTVASGGTVAPGGSIGTLTVGGNFVQAAGSTYRVEINPAGQSDRINVLGTATIQGGTVYADKATGVYAPGTRYTILNAVGGVTGTYTSLEQNAPFVNLKLAYDASNVFLDVERNAIAFCSVASTRNQCATGNGVESLGSGALYDAVAGQPSEEAARAAFDALSGEIYASARGAMLDDTRLPRQAVLARLANAGEGNGAWGQVFGNWGSNDGDGNAFAMDRDTKGLMAGIDMTAGENWRFGFAAGYTRTDIDIDRIGSNGDIDGVHLMGYAGGSYGPVRIRAGIGYAKLDLGANRSIAFNGFTDAARGKVDGSAFQGFAELGYALPVAGGEIEPYAGFTAVRLRTDAFAETGAGAARLSGQRMSETSSFSTLGLRGNIETGGVRFEGAIAWRHAFGDITPEARLAFAGGDRFTLAGTPLNRDEAMIRAGASIRLAPNLTLGARYEGAIGNRSTDHSAQGVLSLAF